MTRAFILLAAVATVSAAGIGCDMQCYPDSTACKLCTSGNCNVTAGPINFTIGYNNVGLCAPGYYPTTYPACLNTSTSSTVNYTCSKNLADVRDSRILQYAARQLGLAYAVSPILASCYHSCVDVGLDKYDPDLAVYCGDCVASSSIARNFSEVVNLRVNSGTDARSASMAPVSTTGLDDSLFSRARFAHASQFSARRVYVCRATSTRGREQCMRELSARNLVDANLACYDGTTSVACPAGGSGHDAIEWIARMGSVIALVFVVLSLHWWYIPSLQLIASMQTWCVDQSPLLRSLYEGADIILLRWDFVTECPVGLTETGCQLINVMISSGILLAAALAIAIVSHLLSWGIAGKDIGENDNSNSFRGRLAARTFRLTLGGALFLWLAVSLVPISQFCSAVVFSSEHASYEGGAWAIFGAIGIVFFVVIILLVAIGCCASISAASRVSLETRGLASGGKAAPVLAQTPYGEVVSAVGGYSPLYRAYVGHVHGPASLVSATAALWNSGWWNWFPSGEPLSWTQHEGYYDGTDIVVRQFGAFYNSFNPSNIIFGGYAFSIAIAHAIILGVQCIYEFEHLSCCAVRAALGVTFSVAVLLVFVLRRPLLGDNILPLIMLIIIATTWVLYLIFAGAETLGKIGPQVTLITLHFIVYGGTIIFACIHTLIRVAHVLVADGSVPAVSTVAIDVGDRRAVATLVGMENGASYIATTQQQGGLVAVPTYYGSNAPQSGATELIPGAGGANQPIAVSIVQPPVARSTQQAFYPHPQVVHHGAAPQPEVPKDGNWMYTDGDEWPVESSYTIISQ